MIGAFVNNMISRDNILDIKPRRDIYQFISKYPGLHASEITQRMNISRSALRHHLKYLMKLNLITYRFDRKNKRLYVCDQMGIKDQELLGILRQEVPFKIVIYLLFPGYCSKKELAKELKVYPSTIHFHLKKLLDLGVIRPMERKDGKLVSYHEDKKILGKKPVKREIFYMWNNQQMKEDIYRLLITHKKSLFDPSIIDSYYIMVKETDPKIQLKHIISFNAMVDNVLEGLERVGIYPYYPL
jgi:DNA-binding transcriptional ArsR family regulator